MMMQKEMMCVTNKKKTNKKINYKTITPNSMWSRCAYKKIKLIRSMRMLINTIN